MPGGGYKRKGAGKSAAKVSRATHSGGGHTSSTPSPGISDYGISGGGHHHGGHSSPAPAPYIPSSSGGGGGGSTSSGGGGGGGRSAAQVAADHAANVAQRRAEHAAKQIQKENERTAQSIEKQTEQTQRTLEKQITSGKPVAAKDIKGQQAKILVSKPHVADNLAAQARAIAQTANHPRERTAMHASSKALRVVAQEGRRLKRVQRGEKPKLAAAPKQIEKEPHGKAQPKKASKKKVKRIMRAPLPTLDKQQSRVASKVLGTGLQMGASKKELKSSLETGLQESDLRNLKYGDADSQGWRQERTSIYGVKHATSVKKSAKDYFSETAQAGRGKGMSPGELSQAVQRSATPTAYDPHAPQASAILRAYAQRVKKAGGPVIPTSKGGKKLSTSELFYDPGISLKDGQPIAPIGGHSDHVHFASTKPRSILRAAKIAEKKGASVSENPAFGGVAPVHTSTSYHYRSEKIPKKLLHSKLYKKTGASGKVIGEAIDINGASPQVLAAIDKALAHKSGAPKGSVAASTISSAVPSSGVAAAAASGAVKGVTVTSSGGTIFSSSVSPAQQKRISAAVKANKRLVAEIKASQRKRSAEYKQRADQADAAVAEIRKELQAMISGSSTPAPTDAPTTSAPKKTALGL